jgi:hypothetical protein
MKPGMTWLITNIEEAKGVPWTFILGILTSPGLVLNAA